MSAISPAHSGAAALVPPTVSCWPSTTTLYPVAGAAFAATSGTPRPVLPEGTALVCHEGTEKVALKPPPVAPPPEDWSFQTTSCEIWLPLASSSVPPQESTCGLDAGKSTVLVLVPSLEPLSPDATVMVTPRAAADWQALSSAVMEDCDQLDSGPPQLMESVDGLFAVSWTAVVMASINPWSLLGAK